MSEHQAGTGLHPSPQGLNVSAGQTVRLQQVLTAASAQNVNLLTTRGQQFVITSQVSVPGLTQVIPTIATTNATLQQAGVTRILNIAPSPRVNVVGVSQVPGRTGTLISTSNADIPTRGTVSLVAVNASSHPTLVSTLSSPPRQNVIRGRKRALQEKPPPNEEVAGKRRKVYEYRCSEMRKMKEDYAECAAEAFFLQACGNIMDYFVWRKRSPTPQFLHFLRAHRLDPEDDDEDLSLSLSATPVTVPTAPQGVPTPAPSSTGALPPATAPQVTSPTKVKCCPHIQHHPLCEHAIGSQELIAEKAKQEAYVMQRIAELQKEGLWSEKRLPRIQEPQRLKAHWDYLIEEMVWLAADFAQERKWKKAAAKKVSRNMLKFHQEKLQRRQKEQKDHQLQLRRVASFMAREVKNFWGNVEKLVEYKHQTRLDEKRKKALDQHLKFIVDQTEKYSSWLAEGMNKSDPNASVPASASSSRPSSPLKDGSMSDDDFKPGQSSSDDEETIAKAEEDMGTVGTSEEIEMLKRESELPLDDFLKELPADYLETRLKEEPGSSVEVKQEVEDYESSEGDNEDFTVALDKDSTDDEETIQEQEAAEGTVDHKKELEDLQAENELTVDELLAKYGAPTGDALDDSDAKDASEDGKSEDEDSSEEEADIEEGVGLKSLLENTSDNERANKEITDVAAIAESIQPKGNTLSSTSVVTPVPFLLKHTLREYQHIGLDWLVTMFDRKLNGILADEMGLGKTIQTISLLAHLACEKGNWGPHLIIVPTSVMLNWEMELKKWCPAFKILTYYGSQKERKQKRTGWTKPNAFHVCITSYKLVIQDHQSFRRKKWKYLILDEAQNIKNFKSQRWQLLLNFQTQRRLLLTGTPLQNNLMELWSLMHFLMPNVFQSHREFKEWFSNPVTGMIEGNSEYNESIIKRLHKVLRPFLLRRLKTEVEKQLPKKYEHVVMCRLSKRQRFLYDDFMSRAKTRETLATGNLLSVINVLMQLRKVCNHPNLFEVRPTISPFQMEGLTLETASLVYSALDYDPFRHVSLEYLNFLLVELEFSCLAYIAHRVKRAKAPRKLIEEIDSAPDPPPRCPSGQIRIHVRQSYVNNAPATNIMGPRTGPSPVVAVPPQGVTIKVTGGPQLQGYSVQIVSPTPSLKANPVITVPGFAQLVQTNTGKHILLTSSQMGGSALQGATTVMTASGQRLTLLKSMTGITTTTTTSTTAIGRVVTSSGVVTRPVMRVPPLNVQTSTILPGTTTVTTTTTITPTKTSVALSQPLFTAVVQQNRNNTTPYSSAVASSTKVKRKNEEPRSVFYLPDLESKRQCKRREKMSLIRQINDRRCQVCPIYGEDLIASVKFMDRLRTIRTPFRGSGYVHCLRAKLPLRRSEEYFSQTEGLISAVHSPEEYVEELRDVFSRFVLFVPAVAAPCPRLHVSHPPPSRLWQEKRTHTILQQELSSRCGLLHPVAGSMITQFPDPRLIQYDCGKLQVLDRLLRQLKAGHHRVLIFTQMTRMLDVLEAFLNFHGHIYLRLDGTTRVDQRQILMERFNADKRIFCFILSTRSGGIGVNLTGADTVIFYDSDWNPTMDAQAQDRCHRIGQTRDVHIYRLVSEMTVEENILKKANQKRLLGDLAIEGGNFTTAYFKSSTIQDLFNIDVAQNDASMRMAEVLERDSDRRHKDEVPQVVQSSSEDKSALGALESALAAAEDEFDVQAAKTAKAEAAADLAEFDENIPLEDGEELEVSRAEQEVQNLVKQLTPVERYAMRFVEDMDGVEQLAAAEAQIEQQKREWEMNRLQALRDEEERRAELEEEEEEMLTYSREDSLNQVWVSDVCKETMPLWCPPTPPQGDNDVYIDHSVGFLYEQTIMSEAQLPPVYVRKDHKRRLDTSPANDRECRRPLKRYKEDTLYAPRSLFDRPSPALLKMRRDLKLQKYRGIIRPPVPLPGLKTPALIKPIPEPDHVPEWLIHEDYAMLQSIQNYLELPLNLLILSPAQTPNWDLVADVVNNVCRTFRSPKQCRNRYESVISPREEGRILCDPSVKKQKKNKVPQQPKAARPMRTAQLFVQDNHQAWKQLSTLRCEVIKSIAGKRKPTVKPLLVNPTMRNPKHAAVLAECGINYDVALTPVEIANRRAERLAKEKQKTSMSAEQQHAVRVQQQQASPASTSKAVGPSSSPQVQVPVATSTASPTPQAVVVGISQASPTVITSPAIRAQRPIQELVAGPSISQAGQRLTQTVVTAAVAKTVAGGAVTASGKPLTAAQVQFYRLRQQQQRLASQQQLKVLQAGQTVAAAPGQKVAVAMPSGAVGTVTSTQQRAQFMKQAAGKQPLSRTMSETEMAAMIKRQQQLVAQQKAQVSQAHLLAQQIQQAGTSSQTQMATLVKTVSSPSMTIPVTTMTLPQVKAATPQQIRQLTLHQQIMQQRKLPVQKVAQLAQVAGAQLIVQSPKAMPGTMTVQQIQQVIKHVQPQQITHVTGTQAAGQTLQTRVIPMSTGQPQTIQVVTAAPGSVRTSVPNVTIDTSGRPQAGTIKVSPAVSTAQQQAILSQVNAALQGQQLRQAAQSPLRIQAVAVQQNQATSTTQPPADNPQS